MSRWVPGTPARVVLLDLDGTLSDSASGIIASMRHAFAVHGMAQPDDAVMRSFVGPPFARALAQMGFEPGLVAQVVATYRADYNAGRLFDNVVFDGIEEALEQVQAAGVALLVATSKPQPTARRIVEHFGLQRYLSAGVESVFGADPHGADTKADVIARALAGYGVSAGEHTVMVGDRLHDVEGAQAHDLACIGVRWGYAGPGELEQAGAVLVVDSPAQLVQVLLGTCGV